MTQAILEFAIVAGAMTLVPGLDFTFVLRTALTQHRVVAVAAALGIAAGLLLWALAAAIGLGALLATSTVLYSTLQVFGALYMLYLGFTFWRGSDPGEDVDVRGVTGETALSVFRKGLLTNLLNPKIGVFYLAVLPPFIPSNSHHVAAAMTLASIHVVECLVFFAVTIAAAQAFKRQLERNVWRKRIDRISGALIIGFGIRVLSEVAR